MNKYLEKVAFAVTPRHAMLTGAVLGGAAGGYAGHKKKTKHVPVGLFSTKEVKKTDYERKLSGVGGAALGALYGAAAGLYIHPTSRKEFRDAHSGRYQRHSGPGHNQAAPSGIHAIHEKLHMPKGGFKTKREATAHFRKVRSQYHPDKHPAKREEMNKKMAEINAAWDAFEKHPEGFTKLANAYLTKIAAVDWSKVKSVVKKNPLPVALGAAMGADGLASTTRKKNEHAGKFHLRQLRNTATGVGVGAVTGKVIQEGYKHISK